VRAVAARVLVILEARASKELSRETAKMVLTTTRTGSLIAPTRVVKRPPCATSVRAGPQALVELVVPVELLAPQALVERAAPRALAELVELVVPVELLAPQALVERAAPRALAELVELVEPVLAGPGAQGAMAGRRASVE
jgi:hypothetical protein